jgi:hypothetical protein
MYVEYALTLMLGGLLLILSVLIFQNIISPDTKGWLLAVGLLLLLLVPVVFYSMGGKTRLDGRQISALGHAVDVSIASCVCYLTLYRFRIHGRIRNLAEKWGKGVPIDSIIEKFKNREASYEELMLLTVFYFSEDERAISAFINEKGRIRNTEFFQSLRGIAMRILLKGFVDRKIAIIILVSLCVWQITAAFIELYPRLPFFVPSRAAWAVLGLTCLGFIAPGLSWLVSELILNSINRQTQNWRINTSKYMASVVPKIPIPPLGS